MNEGGNTKGERNKRAVRHTRRRRRVGRGRRPSFGEIAREIAILCLLTVGAIIAYPFVWAFKKLVALDKRDLMIMAGLAGILIVSVAIAVTFWFANRKNSAEIYMGERKIAVVRDMTVTEQGLTEAAIAKLEQKEGVPVKVAETVSVKLAHTKATERFDTVEYAVGELYAKFTYTVQCVEITVDGELFATVKTDAAANAVFADIVKSYYQEGLNIDDSKTEFVERVEKTPVYAPPVNVMTEAEAFKRLTANKIAEITYTVKDGDRLWNISQDMSISLEKLYALNPSLDNDPTKLRPGGQLKLSLSVPVLSVRTKELTEYPETVKMPIKEVTNAEMPRGTSKVTQQGRDGMNMVRAYIVRENGFEVGLEVIETRLQTAPIEQIVEVGGK